MFALLDYILFRMKLGNYSASAKRRRFPINASWQGEYNPILERILTSGDLLFFSSDASFISWLVRYFTKTDISHSGVYIGEGKVLHATLDGGRIDHLSSFFDNERHVMPVSMRQINQGKEPVNPDFSRYLNSKYPIKRVVMRGTLYLFGVPWRKFRATYLADIAIICAGFSACLSAFFSGYFVYSFIALYGAYLTLVLVFFLARKHIKLPIADPGEGFYYLPPEAAYIANAKKLNERD